MALKHLGGNKYQENTWTVTRGGFPGEYLAADFTWSSYKEDENGHWFGEKLSWWAPEEESVEAQRLAAIHGGKAILASTTFERETEPQNG